MRVIDEKGRLFGKINLIDLLVLLLVIVAGVFLVTKFVGDKTSEASGTKLIYTVKVENVSDEVYQSMLGVTLPDQLMAAGNMLNGKVVSMSELPGTGAMYSVPYQDGASVRAGETTTHDLTFTVEAYVQNAVKNELGTQEVRLGKIHILKTKNFEFDKGVITSLHKEEPKS